jgi:hypothetical protein
MIIKAYATEQDAGDRYAAAGAAAEQQMAFYLKRKFGDHKNVWVFNNIRLEKEDDAAQIDHLIMYRGGFILIESKSVTSRVKINARGEWCRLWDNHWQGMPSPVQQGKLQADFLRKTLNENFKILRDKIPLVDVWYHFGPTPMDVLVAISDKGMIDGSPPAGVHKADQITDEIEKIIKAKSRGLLERIRNADLENFSDGEVERIHKFLLENHRPRAAGGGREAPRERKGDDELQMRAKAGIASNVGVRGDSTVSPLAMLEAEMEQARADERKSAVTKAKKEQPAAAKLAAPAAGVIHCVACGSEQIQIQYGPHGYYYRCEACTKGFAIDHTCPQCGKKARLRKSGPKFYKECGACGDARLWWVNDSGR